MTETDDALAGITAYRDVCDEIDLLKLRAEDQERGLKYASKKIHNRLPGAGGAPVIVPLEKALLEYDEALMGLKSTLEQIRMKETTRRKMEEVIGNIEGLEKALAYQRDALGLPLAVIADRLGYSLGHIKNISSRIPRRRRRTRERK
jgi:DNA-directed RNA polymerase specialized sigma24 family protein